MAQGTFFTIIYKEKSNIKPQRLTFKVNEWEKARTTFFKMKEEQEKYEFVDLQQVNILAHFPENN